MKDTFSRNSTLYSKGQGAVIQVQCFALGEDSDLIPQHQRDFRIIMGKYSWAIPSHTSKLTQRSLRYAGKKRWRHGSWWEVLLTNHKVGSFWEVQIHYGVNRWAAGITTLGLETESDCRERWYQPDKADSHMRWRHKLSGVWCFIKCWCLGCSSWTC